MAKGLTADDLRTEPEEVLVTKLKEAKEELFNLRFRNAMRQLDNPLKIREARREMARFLTVLREKEGVKA